MRRASMCSRISSIGCMPADGLDNPHRETIMNSACVLLVLCTSLSGWALAAGETPAPRAAIERSTPDAGAETIADGPPASVNEDATPQLAPTPVAAPVVPAQEPTPATPPAAPAPAATPASENRPVNAPAGPFPARLQLRQAMSRGPEVTLFVDARTENGGAFAIPDRNQFHADIGPYPTRIEALSPPLADAAPSTGAAVIFLVDVSKSLSESRFNQIKGALKQWVAGMADHDRAALITFGETVATVRDFSANKPELNHAVDQLQATGTQTRLHDGLLRTLDMGQRQDAGLPIQRAVLLLSDGLDDVPGGATQAEIQLAIESASLPIYAVGFASSRDAATRDAGFRALGGFARTSGGEFFRATDDKLGEAILDVHRRLREVQTVQARCDTCPADGRIYPVQISVQDGGRIVTGAGHVRLMAGPTPPPVSPPEAVAPPAEPAPAAAPLPAEAEPATRFDWLNNLIAWLPESLRPYWGLLVVGLLVLLILALLLGRIWRRREVLVAPPVMGDRIYEDPPPAEAGVTLEPALPGELPTRMPRQNEKFNVSEEPGLRMTLSVVDGSGQGQHWTFMLRDRVTLGRSPSCDVTIDNDAEISNRHSVLLRDGERVFVEDTQSTNGTAVNGVAISARFLLEDGDTLEVGRTTLRINWH